MKKVIFTILFMLICSVSYSAQFLYKDVCLSGQGDDGGDCDYTTLESCIVANQQDLTGDGWFDIEIKGEWATADTTQASVNNYITTVDDDVRMFTSGSARHSGVWSETAYRMEATSSPAIVFTIKYATMDGFQIKRTASSGNGVGPVGVDRSEVGLNTFKNNIIRGDYSGSANYASGISTYNVNTKNYLVYNNIFYGFINSTNSLEGYYKNMNTSHELYNNTFYGNYVGIKSLGFGGVTAKNNLSYNNTTDYDGPFTATSTHNASSDATAPEYNTYYDNVTITFVNTESGTEDFHLVSGDTDAIDAGTALGSPYNVDIDGDSRPQGSAWDIGADEFIAAGGEAIRLKYSITNVTIDGNVTFN